MHTQRQVKQSIFNIVAGILFAGLFGASPAGAQQAEEDAGYALEEVIVTAQRREQSLQDVNLAITAFTQSDLDRMGTSNIERLDLLTPGLESGAGGAAPLITMRGLSASGFNLNLTGPVGMFVNGIYRSRGQQAWMAMLDAERVEITRGPQGTLYGRNTTAGNINIVSNKPGENFEAFGDVTMGNYARIQARATVNIPLADTWQFRGSVLYEKHDAYIENSNPSGTGFLDEDQVYFQGALRFAPNEDLEVIVRGHYWDQGGVGYGFNGQKFRNLPGSANSVLGFVDFFCTVPLGFFGLPPGACVPGAQPPFFPGSGEPANDLDPYNIDYEFPSKRDVNEWGVSAHINWDFNNIRFTSITGYTDYFQFSEADVDNSAIAAWAALIQIDIQAFSQEIHISSIDTEPLDWLVGFYYFDEPGEEIFTSTLLSFPIPGFVDPRLAGIGSNVTTGITLGYRFGFQSTESQAAFGQATYSVTDRLRITGGVRYTEEDISYESQDTGVNALRALPFSSRTFSKTTWLAGIAYDLAENSSVYFNASTGFRSGFFNRTTVVAASPPGATESVEPEEIENYAFGSKNRFFDDRLQVNAELFWNDITNAHTFIFDPSIPGAYGTSAGLASTFGVEVELAATPTDRWNVTASLAYLDAEYDLYEGFTDGTPGNVIDASGHKRERSPEWTASFTAAYDIPMGERGVLTPYVQVAYKDDYFITALNDPFLDHEDSFTQTDVRLGWESADGHWNAEAFIQNIEDNGPIIGGFYAFSGVFVISGPEPRTYGARVGYRF